MSEPLKRPATVLAISAHDPSGAAGLQADIEAINQCGCRCASLLTATTSQNTEMFEEVFPQPVEQLRKEARLLLADMSFAACKIGMLGAAATADFVADLLAQTGHIPVVLDPILYAGTGAAIADASLLGVLRSRLFPLATVATPNCREARELADTDDLGRAADQLLALGAANVLITGADEPTPSVINILFRRTAPPVTYEYDRLPHRYHGSGCTLASAIAALLARGLSVEAALEGAQSYTWNALRQGTLLGKGQYHPGRGNTPSQAPG